MKIHFLPLPKIINKSTSIFSLTNVSYISEVNQLGLVQKNNNEFILKITTNKENIDFAITPETIFDLASLSIGVHSLTKNLQEGKYTAAFVDGVGVVIDTGAAVIPIVPGGAGVGIKAYRNMDEAVKSTQLQFTPWKPATQLSSQEANIIVNNSLPSGVKIDIIADANKINEKALLKNPKYDPPILPDSKVVLFTTTKETEWVRVFNDSSSSEKVGNWVMKKEDIRGLSATQIAKKYSLPQVPNMITDVKIPANQKMEASMANNILKGKKMVVVEYSLRLRYHLGWKLVRVGLQSLKY